MNLIVEALLNTMPPAMLLTVAVYFLLRRFNAATRHAGWWVTLVAILVMPFLFVAVTSKPNGPVAMPDSTESEVVSAAADYSVRLDPGKGTNWFGLIWAAGALLMIGRLAASYRALRRIKRAAIPLPVPRREPARGLRLLSSHDVPSPVAVGFWHPAIIVPAGLAPKLTLSELDGVLLHEYAHLARRDDWMNLLGRFLQALLWFHPVARFILGRMALTRELACDEWVVYRTGNARAYAATLLKLAELRGVGSGHALATGILGCKPHLSYRIEQMLRLGLQKMPSVSLLRLSGVSVVVIVLAIASVELPCLIVFEKSVPGAVAGASSGESYLAGLQAAGYNKLEVDEIIELKNNGVRPQYIVAMTKLMGILAAKQLIDLSIHGVRPEDVIRAKKLNSKVTVEQIVKFKTSGILE